MFSTNSAPRTNASAPRPISNARPSAAATAKPGTNAKTNVNYKDTPMLSWARDTGIVVLVIIVTLIIILLLVYLIRLFKTTGLKRVDLISKVIPLDQRTNLPYVIPAGKMAVTTRGQEFTYSFWIYLSEFYENSMAHKVLFMRGNQSNSFAQIDSNANPIVMLDKATNSMYFVLSTTAIGTGTTWNVNEITNLGAQSGYVISKVDYVPLQRWVHFALVVRDNTQTIFMDGDIYTINTTNDTKTASGIRPITRGTAGDAIIGDPNTPIKGFLGKFEFYNYGLSHKQIQSIYKGGPVNKSFLSYMGLGNYGVRSPVYNMDSA